MRPFIAASLAALIGCGGAESPAGLANRPSLLFLDDCDPPRDGCTMYFPDNSKKQQMLDAIESTGVSPDDINYSQCEQFKEIARDQVNNSKVRMWRRCFPPKC